MLRRVAIVLALTAIALAVNRTTPVRGGGETPEQRLKNAGFTSQGAPNFLTLFGSQPIDHGALLGKGALTVAVIEFNDAPAPSVESSDQVIIGKSMLVLVGAASDELRSQFADAVRIARG